ncbi:unnamed protein product [Rotaria sordida]|uniref:Uncharacterized protein n=1 Tax=Rotaria sordida TaxID=392033 RepID=A0A818RQC2_9BILA|nr:unnamed protein product [Rotaria sordida]CAF3661189.1 unnamed protein product [Rotaria sordida]
MKISRDFSQTTIERISRKKSSKRLYSEKQNIKQHLHLNRSKRRRSKRMQSNVIHQLSSNRDFSSNVSRYRRSALSSNMSQTLINWKQNNINNNIQDNRISTPTKKEKNQLILSNLVRDCLPINSIINSTTYFDMSNTHRFLSRNHQINPINSEIQQIQTQLLYRQVSMFNDLIAIANKISLTAVTTTTQTSVCTTGGITCPTPILSWSRTNNCTRSSSSYVYYSCCYLAVSTQLTIQFQLQEQVSHWYIDEVSMIQSNGELIINGGFESNLTGWTVIPSTNLSVTSYAHVAPGAARFGSAYLYSEAVSGPDYIKQTFNVVQGQNVNVSFWWLDEGGVGGANDICEGIVTLTP